MARRLKWNNAEKKVSSEGLVALQSRGFDVNDTEQWYEDGNATAVIAMLCAGIYDLQ